MKSAVDIDALRRYAVSRTLFRPTTLGRAIDKLGFVQADPIRAPARAQDLTLRHRVRNYRAGDLERRYPKLGIEEDFFVNYGFLPAAHQTLMHPRSARPAWSATAQKRALAVLEFIGRRGTVHPREVDEYFSHGRVTNYWGGSSNATTHLLDRMHYRGMLRVARRDNGIRIYALQTEKTWVAPIGRPARIAQLDALIDLIVGKYAPLPANSLRALVWRLRHGAPQLHRGLASALARAKLRLAHVRVDAVDWYWPANERPGAAQHAPDDQVRFLAPFDPVVWDRRRFELFWGWAYRFEAYTPPAKRTLGYYALPLLWRDKVIGWGNLSVENAELVCKPGYVARVPDGTLFKRQLAAELDRMRTFLGL